MDPTTEIYQLKDRIHQLERELQEQRQSQSIKNYYESILALLPGHVYWIDKDHHYLGCNNLCAEYCGLSSRLEIIGKTNQDLFPPDVARLATLNNQAVMRSGVAQLIEETVVLPSGPAVFLSHKVPLYDEAHQISGMLGVSLNITQQKETEKALAETLQKAEMANVIKDAFIANMSHDIRTPLNGIIGMSALLSDLIEDETNQQYAQWIHESGNQLLHLLNHILELIETDTLQTDALQEEIFSLPVLIEEVAQLERPSVQLKGLRLHIEIDESVPTFILADRIKLHRVLLNLVGNAVKFTQQGEITIKIETIGAVDRTFRLMFHIIDTGIGIPLSAHESIFDRFYRVSPSDKSPYQGSGVGLHIVKTYIELLNGKLHLQSETHQGSTFSFELSVHAPQSCPILSPQTPVALVQSDVLPVIHHVLLVEDNVISLKFLEQIILKSNFNFYSAHSAEEALLLLDQQKFELVVTDLGLPGLSGIELTKKIRAHPSHHCAFIIGLTAHAPPPVEKACLEAGMNLVLTKPINLEQLQQVLACAQVKKGKACPPACGVSVSKSLSEQGLNAFPVLDMQRAIETLGEDLSILKNMLALMLHEQIPHDFPLLKAAYTEKNWEKIGAIAHKIKAGAFYCGTIRLQMICQHVESHCKIAYTPALEGLYQQLVTVLQETMLAVQRQLSE